MPLDCILPAKAEALKKAFQKGEISFDKLYKAGSTEKRIKLLESYIGDYAPTLNAKIEKVFLSNNQKTAAKNVFYKEIAQKSPLYKGITLEQAEKIAKDIDIYIFKKKTSEERLAILSKYLDAKTAKFVNDKFNIANVTGKLANWEERTFGTKEMRENKKLKGALAKLEILDNMGVLTPEKMENFMEGFIEEELGISLSIEESQKLSQKIKKANENFDKVFESRDWTHKNKKQLLDYFTSIKELRDYSNELEGSSIDIILNKMIGVARNNLLGSPKSLLNSFFYGVLPGIERTITRRIISSEAGVRDLNASYVEKMIALLSSQKMSKKELEFITEQVKMAVEIYHKTGFDISRIETLNDFDIFGGEKFRTEGDYKKFKDAKGIKEKIKTGLHNYARFTNLFPKWFAGGTDLILANTMKADSILLAIKQRVKLEEKTKSIPNGMTAEQRSEQLLKDAYSFNSSDPVAQRIRELGIFDAHKANSTQKDGLADASIGIRDAFKIKGVDIGKVFVPFAKIATTTASMGLKTATGVGVAQNIYQIVKAEQLSDTNERNKQIQKAISEMVGYVGLYGAALIFSSFLDDDDYIGSYYSLSTKEYSLAKAQAGGTGYIRIGGKWIPLKFFPIVSIPLSAIMESRQAKEKEENSVMGYMAGLLSGFVEIPGIDQVNNAIETTLKLAKGMDDLKSTLDDLGLDGGSITDWVRVRALPASIGRDLWNFINPLDSKYDFLGREVERGSYWKDDKSNSIIREFNRLNNEGFMPVVADPDGVEEKRLNELKKNYSEKVSDLIGQSYYQKMSSEDKKKAIDKIRQKEILDKKE